MTATQQNIHPRSRPSDSPSAPATRRRIRITLGVAGGVAIAIGTAIALAPRWFIDIEGEPTANLLSETRSPGAVLLAVGAFVVVTVIRRRHLRAAATMATLVYLGYGLARVASLVVDGRPSGSLLGAMIVELVLGIASLGAVASLRSDARVGDRVVDGA